MDPDVLLNGVPIPWRVLNEQELAKLERDRAAGKRMAASGMKVNEALQRGRQFHVVLQDCPQPGDNLAYSHMPEGYDEFRVQWADPRGTLFHMKIGDT